MKTATMKLSEITPAEYNPRKKLKPGDTEYEALKNSLERFGVAEPLIVNETTGKLVSGHQRLNVLLEMGTEEVEVVLVQLDEEQEKLLNIAMNKIEGDWDYGKPFRGRGRRAGLRRRRRGGGRRQRRGRRRPGGRRGRGGENAQPERV